LQQQVQLEMSAAHRSGVEQQRLQQLLHKQQAELDDARRLQQQQQQHDDATVPLEVYDALLGRAVEQLQRRQHMQRWRRVFKMWGLCKCVRPIMLPCVQLIP